MVEAENETLIHKPLLYPCNIVLNPPAPPPPSSEHLRELADQGLAGQQTQKRQALDEIGLTGPVRPQGQVHQAEDQHDHDDVVGCGGWGLGDQEGTR